VLTARGSCAFSLKSIQHHDPNGLLVFPKKYFRPEKHLSIRSFTFHSAGDPLRRRSIHSAGFSFKPTFYAFLPTYNALRFFPQKTSRLASAPPLSRIRVADTFCVLLAVAFDALE